MIDIYTEKDKKEIEKIIRRRVGEQTEVTQLVKDVFAQIRMEGDTALRYFSQKYDGFSEGEFLVSEQEIKSACDTVSPQIKSSIAAACENIRVFHSSQIEHPKEVTTPQGVVCYRRSVGIERVGLYVPGGTAPLFSTVLMLAVPASIAACREVVLCTPPDKNGKIAPEILYAAHYTGVKKIYKLGGIQAIAAMTFGTQSIPSVYKIFGPGNSYVTAAKQYSQNFGVSIDMPAGPSEVMVVADEGASENSIAADLLAQLEHGVDSQAILITNSEDQAKKVIGAVNKQLKNLPREQILSKSLSNLKIFVSPDISTTIEWINSYAPEHLILSVSDTDPYEKGVVNAGSVFLGYHTPESLGDYASGTNHTLPTSGWAKSCSGVSLDSFVKKISYQRATAESLSSIAPTVTTMALAEGLKAHSDAVSVRLSEEKESIFVNKNRPKLRENILRLSPYSSARDEFVGEAKVMLDANELPYDMLGDGCNRYPDPHHKVLKSRIASVLSVGEKNITLCNGSDECIDIVLRSFCTPSVDNIVCTNPSYGMYAVSAAINDISVRRVSLSETDFSLDPKEMLMAADMNTKAMFICSPNNPTGNVIPIESIEYLASNFSGLVIVDQAYIDFSEGDSAVGLIDTYPNVIVIQTLSKAWGAAGLRIGILIASRELTEVFAKVKPPYNISHPAQIAALKQLFKEDDIKSGIQTIILEREAFAKKLSELPIVQRVYPSQANFLLVRFDDAKSVYDHLVNLGVVVRSRVNEHLCSGCLRITIGTEQENEIVYDALKDFV